MGRRYRYIWVVTPVDGKDYLCLMREDFALSGIEKEVYRRATQYDLEVLSKYEEREEREAS